MTSIILTGTTTDFTTDLLCPLRLNENKKYEAALLSLDTYNSIPNITNKNNIFKYSTDNGNSWQIITFNKGSYELTGINDELQRQMIEKGHFDRDNSEFYVSIIVNVSELKSIVNITNRQYLVDFTVENSIGSTLGFQPVILSYGRNTSQDIVNITGTNLVLVNVDIISGSYVNGGRSPAIYSFNPNKVSPGYKIDERPNPSLIYYPVNRVSIDSVRVWLTDQNSKLIDLRGEKVTVNLHIREVKNTKQLIKQAIKELKEENILI
jgi:hypothetical protein